MTSTTNQTEQFNQTTTEENEALEQLPFTVHLIELRPFALVFVKECLMFAEFVLSDQMVLQIEYRF